MNTTDPATLRALAEAATQHSGHDFRSQYREDCAPCKFRDAVDPQTVLALLDHAERAEAVVAAAKAWEKAYDHHAVKWRQDNCPERGDFVRWYHDRDVAWQAVEKLRVDLVNALAALQSD